MIVDAILEITKLILQLKRPLIFFLVKKKELYLKFVLQQNLVLIS